MANDFEVSIDVAVSPEEAWALAGDPGRVGEWFAPVVECVMEGDVRTVTMSHGGVLVERVDRDDAAHTYSYTVLSGIPGLTSHRATLRAVATPGGATILWRQTATSDTEGYDIESRLGAVMLAGLERLRNQLEGGG